MRVLILAAGYGTRLYPVTIDKPKALISIKGNLLIDFVLDRVITLSKHVDIEEIIVISNGKFYEKFLDWEKRIKINVTIMNDGTVSPNDRLGTIGDIRFVISKRKNSDWLILGADNFFNWDLMDFIDFSIKRKPYHSVGIYDIGDKNHAGRFGVVELGKDMRISSFLEKPAESKSSMIATCIYFFSKESLYSIEEFIKKETNSDASGRYIEWMVKNYRVYGYIFKGKWFDIGHRDALKELEVFTDYVPN